MLHTMYHQVLCDKGREVAFIVSAQYIHMYSINRGVVAYPDDRGGHYRNMSGYGLCENLRLIKCWMHIVVNL